MKEPVIVVKSTEDCENVDDADDDRSHKDIDPEDHSLDVSTLPTAPSFSVSTSSPKRKVQDYCDLLVEENLVETALEKLVCRSHLLVIFSEWSYCIVFVFTRM